MFKTFGSAVLMLIILLSVSFSSVFVNKVFGEGPGGKGLGGGMIWRLDLSKEQRDKIAAQESVVRKETALLRQTIRDLGDQLNAELSAENPDKTKVNGLIDSISKNMTQVQMKEISFMLWMREQLTPEQKQKLLTLLKNRQETGAENKGPEK